jgi:hypothetical protein
MRNIAAASFLAILAACGGGGDNGISAGNANTNQTIVPTKLSATQSTSLLVTYLSDANQSKYTSYSAAARDNTFTYATSIGARVSGNGVLLAANIQSFKSGVNQFISDFLLRVNEMNLTYLIDGQTLSAELTQYQTNDAGFIVNNIGGSATDAAYINDAYRVAKQTLASY